MTQIDENFYYTAPSDKTFNEVKQSAYQIWKSYDDTYGYATEKINRIKDLKNVKDNCMYIIAMFDGQNQSIMASHLSDEARAEIIERLLAGGTPAEFNMFMSSIDRLMAMIKDPEKEAPFSWAVMEEERKRNHASK